MLATLQHRIKRNISYHWGDDHLLIVLGNRIQPRIRVLFWAEFVLTTGMATVFLMRALPAENGWLNWAGGVGAAILYLLAAYRFLSRMLFDEKILLDDHSLTVIHRTPFFLQTNSYLWSDIGPLHYTGKSAKTDHPLKGKCYDYLGFETQEHLIQNLHHDGNLSFTYKGMPVRFGKNVFSWDAEEIVRMMKLFKGENLNLGPEWKYMIQEHEWDDL